MQYIVLVLAVIVLTSFLHASIFADTISLDKQNYVFGDVLVISGKVVYLDGYFMGLQILNPTKSDIVMIDQFLPKNDGSFFKSYKAQGTKWSEDGVYTIKLVYDKQTYEKTFQFRKSLTTETSETTPTKPSESNKVIPLLPDSTTPKTSSEITSSDLKSRIQGFPDPSKSPKYYFERYANESQYKDWFDGAFPDSSISQVVGYKPTHIEGFPDNNNSPWYYVDRYNTEENYRDWFDSQFPSQSIYQVLGYPDSFFQKVPDWVKNNAKWWSSGLISDSDFLKGIEYLINEQILIVSNLSEPEKTGTKKIPVWVMNTAQWWADGQIDENDFLKGIKFLIQNGIINV